MNISDRHGGGLTLQRILGETINEFDEFLQLFDPKDFATSEKVVPKETPLWKQFPEFRWKEMPKRYSPAYFYNLARRTLGLPNQMYLDYDYKNLHFSRILLARIDFDNSSFLVVPQHHQSVLLTNILASKRNMRYCAWVMDDHVLRFNRNSGFHYPRPPYYEKAFKTFLSRAKCVFVISENMRQFYKKRFDIDSLVLFGPSDWSGQQAIVSLPDGPIRLCYFGAVWKWQEDALEKLSNALGSLDATLDIYTFHKVPQTVADNKRIRIMEPVSSHLVKERMNQYDAVSILFGFSDEVRALSELNISTKLSECLASGIPTILVGPEYGAMTDFGRRHECCIILSDLTDQRQIEEFKIALHSPKREVLLEKASIVSQHITSTQAMRDIWNIGWSRLN